MEQCQRTFMVVAFIALSFFCLLPWVTQALAGCCDKWEGIPAVTMKVPGQAKSQGAKNEKSKQEGCKHAENVTLGFGDLEKYHGHICPGIALGYRATLVALAHLYPGEIPPRGDQFVVSGIPRACPAEAISYITGARYGKGSEGAFNGNLALDKSIGDSCYVFAGMTSGKAIKLTTTFQFPKEIEALKVKKNTDPEAKAQYETMFRSTLTQILTAPEKEVFTVTPMEDFAWKEYKENYLK